MSPAESSTVSPLACGALAVMSRRCTNDLFEPYCVQLSVPRPVARNSRCLRLTAAARRPTAAKLSRPTSTASSKNCGGRLSRAVDKSFSSKSTRHMGPMERGVGSVLQRSASLHAKFGEGRNGPLKARFTQTHACSKCVDLSTLIPRPSSYPCSYACPWGACSSNCSANCPYRPPASDRPCSWPWPRPCSWPWPRPRPRSGAPRPSPWPPP